MSETTTILLLGASPDDRVRLALDAEFDRVQDTVRRGSLRDRFRVQVSHETRAEQLIPLLLEAAPAVVHFSGHGTTSEGLIFQNPSGGSQPLDAAFLQRLFRDVPSVRCVVLNACYSASQAAAISACVGAVISMADQISDAAATAFSSVFYQALAEGHPLRRAFDLAVLQVRTETPGEATTPTWQGDESAAEEVLAAQPQHRGVIARRLYDSEYLNLAQSISALLDDAGCGSVVEEVFGEFVVAAPPVQAGAELRWLQSRVLIVASERTATAPMTGEAAVDRVLRAIRALPREQAQMLLHRFHHHRTDAEIAGEMQLPETQVASSIAAAMQQVAALVKAMQ